MLQHSLRKDTSSKNRVDQKEVQVVDQKSRFAGLEKSGKN
jgi:hypothetical protein